MPIEHSSPGLSDKIQDILSQIISSIMAIFSSLQRKELKLNNRVLVVEKQLGEGGFSFVYLVRDKKDGVKYALKRINTQLEEQAVLLKAEIEAHKAVSSPHVLKLLDSKIVSINGRVSEGLLLLPLFVNGTVQDLIERSEEISLKDICSLGRDICKGLEAFHGCVPSLAFRDLKPANILISNDNRAVLMDLGSVSAAVVKIQSRREAVSLQELCAQTCTAPFRAPELFDPPSNCTITAATDIWSLGCTLYAMAYKQSPFDGSMTAATSANISFKAQDSYGKSFQSMIKAILQPNPANRPTIPQIIVMLEKLSPESAYGKENA